MRACMGLGWGGGMRDGGWEMGDVTGVSPGEEEGDWFEGVGWLGGLGRVDDCRA